MSFKSTLQPSEEDKIRKFVSRHGYSLPVGVGNKESACSIASINLALDGRLTDQIPKCMSMVVGKWIIQIQDRMPASIRNSEEWKNLLPYAAGTGRSKEKERLQIILDWMWESLGLLQEIADSKGFGSEWAEMLRERTEQAAIKATNAANAANAAYAADAAADAADADAYAAAYAATDAAYAATDAAYAADAAAYAAAGAAAGAANAAANTAWQQINPVGLLEKLICLGAE